MKQVLIIEAQIKKYRLPFYQQLLEALRNVDIELRVGYSNPPPAEASKQDTCDLPRDYGMKVPGYWLLRQKLLLQPLFRAAMNADLVVIAGDPSTRISDVRNVQIVFKQGIGYDPAKLIESVRGKVGLF